MLKIRDFDARIRSHQWGGIEVRRKKNSLKEKSLVQLKYVLLFV